MIIRRATEADSAGILRVFRGVIATGDTYLFETSTTDEEALSYFRGPGIDSFVADDQGQVIGVYKLIPNHIGRGAHVSNASFMVDPNAQGKGVGQALAEHCLAEARRQGYDAMQFNFVVSTNTSAIALWKKLGFNIVGTLPEAFRHETLGKVDAYVMHRFL